MKLHVNVKAATDGFFQIFRQNLLQAAVALKEDIDRGTPSKIGDLPFTPKVYTFVKKVAENYIIEVEGNMTFIVSNYGTGSLMLKNNPDLDEYRQSDSWNPGRTGYNIMGRKAGRYRDIFGRWHETNGSFYKRNIEYMRVYSSQNGTRYRILPIKPSNSLHIALLWFYKDWIPTCYKNTLNQFNLSKYITYK